jgi:hypothetical protein
MALSLALILALATYGNRERLERVVIACRIYRRQAFFTKTGMFNRGPFRAGMLDWCPILTSPMACSKRVS